MKESDEDSADHVFRRKHDPLSDPVDDSHLTPVTSSRTRPASRRKASNASLTSISSIESVRRPSSSGFGRRPNQQGPPPLNTIPNVYFEEDFHLENPRTFDIVSERSEVVRPAPGSAEEKNASNGSAPAPRKALATNAILQEKLSWYMDTIEMHLINSISTASTTFFTALGSLRGLHAEAAESVEKIKALRKELEALDHEIATTGMDIAQRRRRRENLQQLNNAVQQLRTIVSALAECESQVDSGEIAQALRGIEALENMIAGRGRPLASGAQLMDLRDATALQGVNTDISTLRFRIGKAYETKFIEILLGDLRRHVETVSHHEVLSRWSSASMRTRRGHTRENSAFPAYLTSTENLRSDLMPVVMGLHDAKHITMAISSYREVVLREVRNLIRRPLPSSNDDDNMTIRSASTTSMTGLSQQEKSSILARNLRALDPRDAEELFQKIYISVAETLRRLTTQVKVLFDAASSMGETPDVSSGLRSPPSLKSPPLNSANRELQEDIHLAMDMNNLLGQAVDISHDKIVKVLRVRSEQSSHLPLVWFLRYFTLNLYFANECETLSGRSGTSLKTIVNGHIKDFIQHHADQEKQKLAQGMESDQWGAKDFGDKENALLTDILESSTKDAPAWSEGKEIWIPFDKDEQVSNGRPRSESNGAATKEKTRSAVIDEETFILPQSALLCLQGMSQFLHLTAGIPSMASDVALSLISYLQLFNSRCTQLILGAGATRSAGLKNITTRHLALASQALAFIASLVPHVREFVRRIAGTGSNVNNTSLATLMGEFDKVKRLYQEHQNNIYDKLVEIMSGRAAAHTKTMKTLDWDKPLDNENESSIHVYMETLAKETITLHRVLTKHLPESTVRLVMTPVFESYRNQLGKTFQALEIQGENGIQRYSCTDSLLVCT
jgi:vacuolar protein sorting-associated protein 54